MHVLYGEGVKPMVEFLKYDFGYYCLTWQSRKFALMPLPYIYGERIKAGVAFLKYDSEYYYLTWHSRIFDPMALTCIYIG